MPERHNFDERRNPPQQNVWAAIWGEKGSEYRASYEEVLEALRSEIAEYYRAVVWDPSTTFRHSWFFARIVGLHAWSKREAIDWLPFRPTYTRAQYNKAMLAGRLKRHAGDALSDPDLMTYWIEAAYEKGGQAFSAQVTQGLHQKMPQVSIVNMAFALCWDRHVPPMEFWEYPPAAAMFEYILHTKGLEVSMNEERLRKIASRLGLVRSPYTVVRWSKSEGRGILDFDVDAARIIGLPTRPES